MSPSLGISWQFSRKDSAFPAEGPGLIPGQETRISHATGHGQKNKTKTKLQSKMSHPYSSKKRKGNNKRRLGTADCLFRVSGSHLDQWLCAAVTTAHLSIRTFVVRRSNQSVHRSLAFREQGPCPFPTLAPRNYSSITWAEGIGEWVPATAHAKR